MRSRLAPIAIGACCLAAGCGGGDAPPAPVRLAITAPADLTVVRAETVELSGTVRPANATVTVGGDRATVSGGSFDATVDLAPGTNVIDVLASAGRARPALKAIRVRRLVAVEVPDLVGQTVDEARAQLTDLGLNVEVEEQGGLLERILPGDPKVCASDPAPGDGADPGTTVRLLSSKQC